MIGDPAKPGPAGPDQDSDRTLLSRLRSRDRDALEELARRYGDALNRAAHVYFGDPHDAADVAQDTLLAAWDGVRRVRDDTDLRPWLFGILFNLCRKRQRSWIRRRRRERRAAEQRRQEADGARGDVEERLERLRGCMDRLEEPHRAVVVLRYVQGLSVAETAAALGVPEGTVKSRTHAALAKLRQEMGREDER